VIVDFIYNKNRYVLLFLSERLINRIVFPELGFEVRPHTLVA